MPLQIADVLGKIKPPVRSAWVCLDGELWMRHDELSKEIDVLRAENPGKMGASAGVTEKSRELQDVEVAMRAAEVEFKFRGISSYKRDEIIGRFPSKDRSTSWDTTAGAHALLAAAAVEPTMTEDEAHQLVETAHHGVTVKLFNAAWTATEGSSDVPFSARAFASISGSASK